MRTILDSLRKQKPHVRAIILGTVLAGVFLFVAGISEDDSHLRESGVMLSVVLPIIGLLEDRIYRKSRERYLKTRTAAERAKAAAAVATGAASFDWMEFAGLDG